MCHYDFFISGNSNMIFLYFFIIFFNIEKKNIWFGKIRETEEVWKKFYIQNIQLLIVQALLCGMALKQTQFLYMSHISFLDSLLS